MVLAALLALAGVLPMTLAADIETCDGEQGNDLADFIKAEVSDCSDDTPKCPLYRGKNVSITLKFKTKKEIKEVQHIVHGTVAGVPVPFPLASPDACQNTGLQCPLQVGEHTYNYALFVKPIYPKLKVSVKWELKNEDHKNIVCINIPSELKDSQ
ncbi:NPC intracellular cholesterol transporter 2-like protein a [Frankliniella fusca]|uniref:NPC intracellular cholesterol transporter 2-like protein a n=1 Tax=Frankliniella fusca TaxID=407009 RepID=A0AAE1H0S9_9NEOP|nr:NPC intracellular cholesterol transporter 2-like protein a [Frankliniella fusca]